MLASARTRRPTARAASAPLLSLGGAKTCLSPIESGAWRDDFPGRRILAQFVESHLPGVSYVAFRNLVMDKMVALEARPDGMLGVLREIEPTGLIDEGVVCR